MSLPNTFEIHAKYNPASRHVATLNEAGTKYRIEARDYLENAYNAPVELSVRFVQEALDEGSWIMTKVVTTNEEKTMKFPLHCMHGDTNYQTEDCPESSFKIEKGDIEGFVKVTWRNGAADTTFWTPADCERLIKEGTWLVKHVGEKAEEKYNLGSIKISDDGNIVSFGGNLELEPLLGNFKTGDESCFKGLNLKAGELKLTNPTIVAPKLTVKYGEGNTLHITDESGRVTTVEDPKAPDSNIVSLTVQVNSSQVSLAGLVSATEHVNALAQAMENLSISMESVIALQAQLKGLVNV